MVVIVGAGPSGVRTALNLQAAGKECFIIEKQKFPRFKLCGGLLTEKTYRLYGDIPEDLIFSTVNRIEIASKGQPVFDVRTKYPFRITERYHLDDWYLNKYIRGGGKILQGYTVREIDKVHKQIKVSTENGVVQVHHYDELVIAAGCTGLGSKGLGSTAGTIASCMEAVVPYDIPKEFITLDLGFMKDGYCWKFPKGEDLVVGCGGIGFKQEDFKRYVSLINVNQFDVNPSMAPIPYGYSEAWLSGLELVRNHIYRVGDSAGLVDPLTGEGLYFALKSADFASQSIIDNSPMYYLTNMRNIYDSIKDAQDLKKLIFISRGLTVSAAKFKPKLFRFVCDEVVSLHTIPYKITTILKAYRNRRTN